MTSGMEQDDLAGYGLSETPPPLMKRKIPVLSPTTEKTAGFIGVETKRGGDARVYATLRTKGHYYRAGGGWAISDRILDYIEGYGVSRIIVHDGTTEDDDVYEYPARAYYKDGRSVHEADLENSDDPQSYVPEEEYLHKWEGHAAALFHQDFERACERIWEKRGWPDSPP